MEDIFVIGDTHFPFHSKKALKKVIERLSQKEFKLIIQIGDLLDQYAFSRFTRKNIYFGERELAYGRELAIQMWEDIQKIQPNAKKVQLLGNHDVRILKRAEEKIPEAQELIATSLMELYKFENVETIQDPRKEYIVNHSRWGKIAFIHGHKNKIGDHVRLMHMNVVHGHRHRGEVTFIPIRGQTLWELDCGFLADQNKEPLAYNPQRTTNWTLGFSEITDLAPVFSPLNL